MIFSECIIFTITKKNLIKSLLQFIFRKFFNKRKIYNIFILNYFNIIFNYVNLYKKTI